MGRGTHKCMIVLSLETLWYDVQADIQFELTNRNLYFIIENEKVFFFKVEI